jgi:F-type H+-transporting ATPase subunit epsilon
MKIQIITPDKELYSGEAELAQFPGLDGSFEVMNNHAPMVSALKGGNIRLKFEDKSEESFAIKGGVLEVLNNNMLVLAE